MTEPRRFFIVHMQKSAGTSLRDRFRSEFDEAAIYPNSTDGPDKRIAVISVQRLLERWQARRAEIRVVAGHFPLGTVELLDAPFVTVTVLRPPVERTLSYLRHQKRLNPADRDKTLEEIYEDPFRFNGLIRNHMTRMLSMSAQEMERGDGVLSEIDDTAERLELAQQALRSLDLFGLQPHFEELCDELSAVYGVDLGAPLRSNATEPMDAPASLEARIAEDSPLDVALYEFAELLYLERRPLRRSEASVDTTEGAP